MPTLMLGIRNMYESLIAERLGKRIAEMRVNRGMTKVQFAGKLELPDRS